MVSGTIFPCRHGSGDAPSTRHQESGLGLFSSSLRHVSSVLGNLLLWFTWTTAEVENNEQKSQACGASPQPNPALSLLPPDLRAVTGKHRLSMEEQGPGLQHKGPHQALDQVC